MDEAAARSFPPEDFRDCARLPLLPTLWGAWASDQGSYRSFPMNDVAWGTPLRPPCRRPAQALERPFWEPAPDPVS
jgi:hypothetical protein